MLYPKSQSLQTLNLRDYTVRAIVAGTRGYNDRLCFHKKIVDYIDRFTVPILFISGAASSGADRLIIEWCHKFKYPCLQLPADWEQGRGAGYIRNAEMADIATHLLAFYDGNSPGTKNMIEIAADRNIPTRIIKI